MADMSKQVLWNGFYFSVQRVPPGQDALLEMPIDRPTND
jgi:hypothetical protein